MIITLQYASFVTNRPVVRSPITEAAGLAADVNMPVEPGLDGPRRAAAHRTHKLIRSIRQPDDPVGFEPQGEGLPEPSLFRFAHAIASFPRKERRSFISQYTPIGLKSKQAARPFHVIFLKFDTLRQAGVSVIPRHLRAGGLRDVPPGKRTAGCRSVSRAPLWNR